MNASGMLRLRYDYQGRVRGLPDSLRPGDDLTFELIAEHVDISDNDSLRLTLALEKPVPIQTGTWSFTWGASTATLDAKRIDAHSLGIALNRLDSILTAGGVDVVGANGLYTVTFRSNGARNDFTVKHSVLGTLTNRALTLIAGGAGNVETVELDLTLQILTETTTATDIVEATVAVSNVATGDADTEQCDRITISRLPDAGKFQIRTASDTGTMWLEANVSSYQVEMALEDIEPAEFLVSREVMGETIKIDLRRAEVGVNAAPTVSDTFIGPVGVTMALDTANVLRLLNSAGMSLPVSAFLNFIRADETQFCQMVQLAPTLLGHGQPV